MLLLLLLAWYVRELSNKRENDTESEREREREKLSQRVHGFVAACCCNERDGCRRSAARRVFWCVVFECVKYATRERESRVKLCIVSTRYARNIHLNTLLRKSVCLSRQHINTIFAKSCQLHPHQASRIFIINHHRRHHESRRLFILKMRANVFHSILFLEIAVALWLSLSGVANATHGGMYVQIERDSASMAHVECCVYK